MYMYTTVHVRTVCNYTCIAVHPYTENVYTCTCVSEFNKFILIPYMYISAGSCTCT